MTLTHILALGAVVLLGGVVFRTRGRGWFLFALSALAVYWLQPAAPIRHLDFWLPTATLALAVFAWAVSRTQPGADRRADLAAGGALAAIVLAIALTRYLGPLCCLTPSRPPAIPAVGLGIAIVAAAALIAARAGASSRRLAVALFITLIGFFLVLKSDDLAGWASAGLRWMTGQSRELASPLDLRWLGFSYVAFRLLHTLRDRAAGRLPNLSLQEFVTYVIFFPAFTAGPIDRVERFVRDLRSPFRLGADDLWEGGRRIILGVFRKFVLADALALIALDDANAAQTHSTFWLWILLYAYAFRLYFDFSGYTDIAIGLGRWLGVRLPENFERPYLRPNLTVFWNNWHITLTQWFRSYFFNPLTRALRQRSLPPTPIILVTQLSTMLLIGLWHGVTWNFVAWGAWHGLGLFLHNRWAAFARGRADFLDARPGPKLAAAVGGVLLTFHYVALGWVWFALPSLTLSAAVLRRLFGL